MLDVNKIMSTFPVKYSISKYKINSRHGMAIKIKVDIKRVKFYNALVILAILAKKNIQKSENQPKVCRVKII